jgi:hypothetical protein
MKRAQFNQESKLNSPALNFKTIIYKKYKYNLFNRLKHNGYQKSMLYLNIKHSNIVTHSTAFV